MLVCSFCGEPLIIESVDVNDNSAFELYACPECKEEASIEIDFRTNTKTIRGTIKGAL